MDTRAKKRFIASAKCPACGQLDLLMLVRVNGIETVTCFACGTSLPQPEQKAKSNAALSDEIIGHFMPE